DHERNLLMPSGSARDALHRLIELAYAAAEDAGLWNSFLLSLVDTVKARSGAFLHHDLVNTGSVAAGVNLNPQGIDLYNAHFHKIDPFSISAGVRALFPGAVATDEMLISHSDLKRTEYFNEFASKHEITRLLSVMLRRDAQTNSVMSLLRAERDPP